MGGTLGAGARLDRRLDGREPADDRLGRGRVLAGLSAGGFGAMDIGLRHPSVFGRMLRLFPDRKGEWRAQLDAGLAWAFPPDQDALPGTVPRTCPRGGLRELSRMSVSSSGCVKNGEWPVSSSTIRAPAARALRTCHSGSIAASFIVTTTMSCSQRLSATGWSGDWWRSCANAASDCARVQSGYMCAAHVSASGQ